MVKYIKLLVFYLILIDNNNNNKTQTCLKWKQQILMQTVPRQNEVIAENITKLYVKSIKHA